MKEIILGYLGCGIIGFVMYWVFYVREAKKRKLRINTLSGPLTLLLCFLFLVGGIFSIFIIKVNLKGEGNEN